MVPLVPLVPLVPVPLVPLGMLAHWVTPVLLVPPKLKAMGGEVHQDRYQDRHPLASR